MKDKILWLGMLSDIIHQNIMNHNFCLRTAPLISIAIQNIVCTVYNNHGKHIPVV